MATATFPDDVPPQQLRDPRAVVTYTQRILDHDFVTGPVGLRPKVTMETLPAGKPDQVRFRIAVFGDDFGGPQDATVMLTPEDLDSPFAVRSAFRMAYSEVLRKVGDKLRADRESRPDEDDTDGEDDDR